MIEGLKKRFSSNRKNESKTKVWTTRSGRTVVDFNLDVNNLPPAPEAYGLTEFPEDGLPKPPEQYGLSDFEKDPQK